MNLTTSYTNPVFEMNGYEPKTTFWTDFSIADMFGTDGVTLRTLSMSISRIMRKQLVTTKE